MLPADGIHHPQRAGRTGFPNPGTPATAPRELNARNQSGFDGAADVLELLVALPTPEQILNSRPSPRLSARIEELIEKSRSGQMTPIDEEDWERYEYLDHLVRMAKAAARMKLTPRAGDV